MYIMAVYSWDEITGLDMMERERWETEYLKITTFFPGQHDK